MRRTVAVFAAVVVGATVGMVAVSAPALAAPSSPLAIGQAARNDFNVLAVDATVAGSPVNVRGYVVGTGAAVAAQRWTFELIPTGGAIPVQTYRIRNAAAGLCLQRAASSANGAAVTIAACVAGNDQYWRVPQSASGIAGREIRSLRDNRCIDLYGSSTPGAQTTMWTCTTAYPTQMWKIRYGPFDCPERAITAMCVRPSQPIFGVFAASQQWPVNISVGADTTYNDLQNFVSFETLNNQIVNDEYDVVEMGWSAVNDAGAVSHEMYWSETGVEPEWGVVLERHSLANLPDGAEALGRGYTFMALPVGNGRAWDIFYNFNPVGTTRFTEGPRVAPGLEMGVIARYAQYVSLANPFENHVQLMDGNNFWRQPYLGETSTMQYNTCNDPEFTSNYREPNSPPWCWTAAFDAEVGELGPAEVTHFTVGKPATAARAVPPSAAAPAAGAARHVNGVDQDRLARCMATAPGSCLRDVPGLARCVAARKICNTVRQSEPRSAISGKAMSGDAAAAAARRSLNLPADAQLGTTVMTAARYTATTGERINATEPSSSLHVIYGSQDVSRLDGRAVGPYNGFRLTYDATTGRLLHTCLGRTCPRL